MFMLFLFAPEVCRHEGRGLALRLVRAGAGCCLLSLHDYAHVLLFLGCGCLLWIHCL